MPTRAPIHEQHSRYVLIGGFAKRRRVLELGCLDASAAHVLFDAGATSVTVGTNDPNLAQGEVQTLDDTNLPLPLDSRGFDLVLCHDLPERLARDPGWTHELRRILAPGGILVAAVKNAASDLDYRGLYDLLAPHFGEAAFYGQSSVRGALFYDLEIEELEPEIDRTLLGEEDEEPTWYLAVFAPEALHGGKLTFAQLDATHAEANADVEAEAGFSADAEADTDADAEADAYVDADVDADPLEDAAQAEAEEELRTLELQYQEAQARLADHDQAMDEVMVRLETSELERRQLEETLRVTKSEVQDLENELGATGARALHAEQALAQLQDARRHAAEHDQAAQDAQQALHGRIAELERTMSERETHRHEERALLDAEIGELVAERDRLAAALRSADDRAKNLANDFEAFRNSAYGRERELAKLIEQLEAHHARARESDTQ